MCRIICFLLYYSALPLLFLPFNCFLYRTAGNTVFLRITVIRNTPKAPHSYLQHTHVYLWLSALFFCYCFHNSSPSAVHLQLNRRWKGSVIHPRAIMILFTATFAVLQLVIMRRPFLLFSSTVSPRLVTLHKVKRSMKCH